MPVTDRLADVVGAALAPWRLVDISRSTTALIIECLDERARAHVLECTMRGATNALFAGTDVQFSYHGESGEGAPIESYLAIFNRLLAVEGELVSALAEPAPAREEEPPGRGVAPTVYVTEHALARSFAIGRMRRRPAHDVARELFSEWFPRGEGELHLYLEARCAQHCEFCEEAENRDRPVRRTLAVVHDSVARWGVELVDSGAFDALLDLAATSRVGVMVTGHDWLAHPRASDILSSLERHPSVPKTFQGPSTALARAAVFERVVALPGLRAVRTTLQSVDATQHDAMVGLVGASADLLQVIERLSARSVKVELTTVLTRRALETLPATLRWIAARGLTVTLHAFIPDRGMSPSAGVLAPVDEIRAALAAAHEHAAIASIVGVPRCGLTAELASKLEPAWQIPERDHMAFAADCRLCESRPECTGVPAAYIRVFGGRGLAPEHALVRGGRRETLRTS